MQIRRQLRNTALAVAPNLGEYAFCCKNKTCMSGYHGALTRIRFKARSRHHGTKPGQSKKKGK